MRKIKKSERLKLGLLKIGEIAEEARVLPTTIRYYTDLGLLPYVDRTQGGYRLYMKEETLQKVAHIKELQRLEKSIVDIVKMHNENPEQFKGTNLYT